MHLFPEDLVSNLRCHPFRLLVGVLLASVVAATSLQGQGREPTGTLIVTNKTPSTATLIDVASGRIVATVPTGQGPHEVVVTADGRTAVVTDYGAQVPGSTLTVIDVVGRRVARTISLGEYRRPHGIVLLPGDSVAAVTSEVNRHLLLVHLTSGAIVRAIPTQQPGSHMVGVTGDGRRAWTGNIGSNSVTELDLVTGQPVRTIAVPAQPEAINVTPDGKEVWVGSNATGNVSVVNTATAEVTTAATGFGWPYRVLYSPDTTLVVMPDYKREELRFINRRTRGETGRLVLAGAGPQGIAITPDGAFVFLSYSARGEIALINVRTQQAVRVLGAGETPDGVAYTPRVIAQP